ncbi:MULTISPECIES: hypothetical protein [Clostridia]|uniref:hypothetical protein n=1 Tax=Clostridia TaxID=186801 RepID=UPI0013640C37|nr:MULTISPECIES: hypothetical protein [Clostridia]
MIRVDLLEKVKERLKTFGYEVTEEDSLALAFGIEKVAQSIRNECNQPKVPQELEYVHIDWVCSDFLETKYSFGLLNLESLDLGEALASVSEGDVSISFDNALSDDAKFQILLKRLSETGKDELLCFRRLRW